MKLYNRSRNSNVAVAEDLQVANTFLSRNKGLLGRKNFTPGSGLLIHRCPSIHTFFMAFAIDAVFVDRNLRVRAIYQNLKPWRLTRIVLGAHHVVELPAGTLLKKPIVVGDELYVGD